MRGGSRHRRRSVFPGHRHIFGEARLPRSHSIRDGGALARNDPPLQPGPIKIGPNDHRRNLTVAGVPLNHLVGRLQRYPPPSHAVSGSCSRLRERAEVISGRIVQCRSAQSLSKWQRQCRLAQQPRGEFWGSPDNRQLVAWCDAALSISSSENEGDNHA
jgi:hypothetical protein